MQQRICFFTASFGRGRVKHNIEDVCDIALYEKHFDCDGYFHETDPVARENEIHTCSW